VPLTILATESSPGHPVAVVHGRAATSSSDRLIQLSPTSASACVLGTTIRSVGRFRIKGKGEAERGECEGERVG
jgi:hypothetical protein